MAYDLADLHTSFIRHLRIQRYSKETIRSYSTAVHLFTKFLVEQGKASNTEELTRENLTDWFIFIDETSKPRSYAARWNGIKSFCTWLSAEHPELFPEPPMPKMKYPKMPETHIPMLREDEVATLLKDCKKSRTFSSHRDEAIILLFRYTGIRLAELGNLKLDDLFMDQNLVRIYGKGGKVRIVPFNDRTGQALDRYLRNRKRHSFSDLPNVWLTHNGPLNVRSIETMFVRRGRRSGINRRIHPHMLRHTFIHYYLDSGGQERHLKKITGHSRSTTLAGYATLLEEERAVNEYRRLGI